MGQRDVARDVLALMDALGIDRALLLAHDWGAFVAYLMLLEAPERFDGYLVCNMAHPWQTRNNAATSLAAAGLPAVRGQHRCSLASKDPLPGAVHFRARPKAHRIDRAAVKVYADRFRDPVCARTATDTYRTFCCTNCHGCTPPELRRRPCRFVRCSA